MKARIVEAFGARRSHQQIMGLICDLIGPGECRLKIRMLLNGEVEVVIESPTDIARSTGASIWLALCDAVECMDVVAAPKGGKDGEE